MIVFRPKSVSTGEVSPLPSPSREEIMSPTRQRSLIETETVMDKIQAYGRNKENNGSTGPAGQDSVSVVGDPLNEKQTSSFTASAMLLEEDPLKGLAPSHDVEPVSTVSGV